MSYLSEMSNELEKSAIVGSLAVGGLTAWDIGGQVKDLKKRVKLTPPNSGSNVLGGSHQYQFEGGKHTSLKPTTSPHSSLY